MNTHETIDKWEKYYKDMEQDDYLLPNEYVVRSFLGNYPNLKMNKNYKQKNVCDISCGDGRNIVLLNKLKLNIFGTEISDKICEITKRKLLNHPEKIHADIKKGFNWHLPFQDSSFDYALSWNAIYYMQNEDSSILDHIKEYARILKKDAYLVCSVPTPHCFSLENATPLKNNLIKLNPSFNWGGRNIHKDTIYFRFDSFKHIETLFSDQFYNFQKCTISDDCYGLKLEYFVFVCQKK